MLKNVVIFWTLSALWQHNRNVNWDICMKCKQTILTSLPWKQKLWELWSLVLYLHHLGIFLFKLMQYQTTTCHTLQMCWSCIFSVWYLMACITLYGSYIHIHNQHVLSKIIPIFFKSESLDGLFGDTAFLLSIMKWSDSSLFGWKVSIFWIMQEHGWNWHWSLYINVFTNYYLNA